MKMIKVNEEKLNILLRHAREHCIPLFNTINGEYCKDQCLHCPFLTESTLTRWLKEDE